MLSSKWNELHLLLIQHQTRPWLTRDLSIYLSSRLLEVFKKLRAIAASPQDEGRQADLLEDAKRIVQDICNDHVAAVQTFVRDETLRDATAEDMRVECQLLVEYVSMAKRFNLEINSRAKDRVVSFGEKLSCRFMACLLRDRVGEAVCSIGRNL